MTPAVAFARKISQESPPDLEARLSALQTAVDLLVAELLPRQLAVKDGERIVLIGREAIDWIECAGNYVVIHSAGKALVMRATLADLLRELGTRFLRIRRDAAVNTAAVRELHPLFRGEFRLALRDGSQIQSTRRYRHELDKLIGEGAR
jgi:two-component system LytT family response regulator